MKGISFLSAPTLKNWHLLLPAILSVIILLPALQNGFTYWDDHLYVSENADIRNLSSIPGFFSEYLMGNYHPLVPLTYTLEYAIWGLSPWGYILVNILLHGLNIYLVGLLAWKLSKKVSVAVFTALAFGLHPLHVESVIWISERKDVLHTAFLLGALHCWWAWIQSPNAKNYIATLVLFLLACFAKGQSVVFPLLAILLGWWAVQKVELKFKLIIPYIPLFIISLLFGIIAIFAQQAEGAVRTQHTFRFPDNILAASWGFLFYLWKCFLPWRLSAFYPYPPIDKAYPVYFWAMPPLVIIVGFVIFRIRKIYPELVWGLLFYAFAIFPVIQLLPVGRALTADRYFYVPSIGLFFGLFYFLEKHIVINKKLLQQGLLIIILGWSVFTFNRIHVWKNTESLFRDVLKSFPNESVALNNIATMHAMRKEYDQALIYYEKTIAVNPHHIESVYNIGVVYDETSRFESSAAYFNRVFRMDSNYKDVRYKLALAYNKHGNALKNEGKGSEALGWYSRSIEILPTFAEAWSNQGNQLFFNGDYPAAIASFQEALRLKPDFAEAWSNWGSIYGMTSKFDSAEYCFRKAIDINPEYAPAYFNLGYALLSQGKRGDAITQFRKSHQLGHAQALQQLTQMGEKP